MTEAIKSETVLELENISINLQQYDGQGPSVVNDISLDIKRGEIVGIVGESGSGKSVTALAIMGLLPSALSVTQGQIRFGDEDLLKLTEEELCHLRGKRIAMIFQEPMTALNPVHTIGAQIAEVFLLHQPDLDTNLIENECIKLLEKVEIPEPKARLKQYPHELSGGMRQRVMIAIALACKPDVLIADEPTTALDVTIQLEIMELLRQLQKDLGMAILLISHDLPLVKHYADRIAVMYQGDLVEMADSEQLFSDPQHEYTHTLLESRCQGQAVDSPATDEVAVDIRHLNVRFPLSKGFWGNTTRWLHAVNDIHFTLQRGKTLGVVGESGSGKSTLVRAILQLIKADGEVTVVNERLDQQSGKLLRASRRKIQIVLQDPFGSLSPRMLVEQLVTEGLDIHTNLSTAEKKQLAIDALKEVGLEESDGKRFPHEFSGGQRQRIAIARAIITNPDVIILDEPTSALDRSTQVQVIDLLKRLQKERQLSYIFISHDLEVVKAISHEVAVMKEGKFIEYGATKQVLSEPQQAYTKTLIEAAFY